MYGQLTRKLAATVGTFGSLIALAWSWKPSGSAFTLWPGVFLILAFALFVLVIYWDIRDALTGQPKRMSREEDIRDYMYSWINRGGRVAIFSRDMSWVKDDPMRSLLRLKAEQGELSLFLPKCTDLSNELEQQGAHIFTYRHLEHDPRSRFTIINERRSDAKVAIGRDVKGTHVIEEFALGEHPAFALAEDLVEVIRKLNTHREPAG